MPPVLNNAIAWVSRVGDDFRAMFLYIGSNVLSREIINNYSKQYKKETAVSIVKELIAYS